LGLVHTFYMDEDLIWRRDMDLNSISLNTLRAFAAAARHLSFTGAGKSLFVTQAAVSHQVKALEDQLGVSLFRRTTRGLVLTDEGHALAPVVEDGLGRIEKMLAALSKGTPPQVLNISVVGTYALGFLIERLPLFRALHPQIDVRLRTNNNVVDMWGESLDYAIRFGDGAWRAVESTLLMRAPISPLCAPQHRVTLQSPSDLAGHRLLRSYRSQDWTDWFAQAGVSPVTANGPIFDNSPAMVQAAILGEGIALAPPCMFRRELERGDIVQPFATSVDVGGYWLTKLISKQTSPAMISFKAWLLSQS
jgi:LysR family transcriptional regulator, regulator of gene expression of beta-lactamase